MRRYSIGIDPGRSAALAVVEHDDAPGRRLVFARSIYGGQATREARLYEVIEEVASTIGVIRSRSGDVIGRPMADVWIELPAAGGASSTSRRNGWQVSVGRDIGRWEVLCLVYLGIAPKTIAANVWPRVAGVRCGKSKIDSWLHRVQEARLRLDGSRCLSDDMIGESKASRERRIARSEAALIAFAGSK